MCIACLCDVVRKLTGQLGQVYDKPWTSVLTPPGRVAEVSHPVSVYMMRPSSTAASSCSHSQCLCIQPIATHSRSRVERVYLNPVSSVCVRCLSIFLGHCIVLSSSLYILVYSLRSLTRDIVYFGSRCCKRSLFA